MGTLQSQRDQGRPVLPSPLLLDAPPRFIFASPDGGHARSLGRAPAPLDLQALLQGQEMQS